MGFAQLNRVLTEEQIVAIVAFLDTLTGSYLDRTVMPAPGVPPAVVSP